MLKKDNHVLLFIIQYFVNNEMFKVACTSGLNCSYSLVNYF